jgi:hypothetical protein
MRCPGTWRGIEDLERGDLVKVDCAACHHVALLSRLGALCSLGPAYPLQILTAGLPESAAIEEVRYGHSPQ